MNNMQSPLMKHLRAVLADEALMREAEQTAKEIMSRVEQKSPQVQIGTSGSGKMYAISGWSEFDRFCMHNYSIWKCVTDQSRSIGVTEEDRLRLLSMTLMTRVKELELDNMKYMANFGTLPH